MVCMTSSDLSDIARELMRVAPGEFVASRTAAVREHRSEDRALAAEIGRLRKPAVAAWGVNLLAEDGSLDDAIALGPALRKAQASADIDAIGQLRAQRRELVDSLATRAADRARDAGVDITGTVLEAIGATIEAAMADERAGRAAQSGLLVRPLESVGFDAVDLEGALAVPDGVDLGAPVIELARPTKRKRRDAEPKPEPEPRPEPEPKPEPKLKQKPEDRDAAREAEATARDASRAADASLDAADSAVDDLDRQREELERRQHDLQKQLDQVTSDLDGLADDRQRLEQERDAAEEVADEARAALTEARKRRRTLER
jgi:hypothetical protein